MGGLALARRRERRALASRSGRSGVEQRASFERIRYANCWEDGDLLIGALAPAPGKRIVSIASAGDNSLQLAAHGAEVVAVDLSLAQLACLELRMAAFRALDYRQLLGFLGIKYGEDRVRTYSSIRGLLSSSAQAHWDGNIELIERGVIHGGKFERFFHIFRRFVLSLIHDRETVRELMEPREIEDRIEFYDRRWNNRRWQLLFRVFFGRTVMGWLGRDPEFFRYVEGDVASRIMQRVRRGMTELPTDDNPWLRYIVTGNFCEAALPPYLRPEMFERVRDGVSRITLHHASLGDVLEASEANFDGANLSDIFEYLSDQECKSLYQLLLDRSKPGARIAYWNMLVPRTCPESLANKVRPLEQMSAELFSQDRAFFYSRFVVEEVLP